MLTSAEIDTLVGRIVHQMAPHEVIMFGSHAKGLATPRSDLDLLIVIGERHAGLRRPCDIVAAVGGAAVPLDIHVVTAEEFGEFSRQEHSFLHSVMRTGRSLYRAAGEQAGPPARTAHADESLAQTGLT